MVLETSLIMFVKKTIVELACSNNIDHRNYDRTVHQSKLKELMIKNNYNLDLTIEQIVKESLEDITFLKMLKPFQKKITLDAEPKKNPLNDIEHLDYDEDDLFELKTDVYYRFIEFVGLNELLNLHGDVSDVFQADFIKAISL